MPGEGESKTLHILVHGSGQGRHGERHHSSPLSERLASAAAQATWRSMAARRFANCPWTAGMTVCNMTIEGGARAGMARRMKRRLAYLEGRPFVPRGREFQEAIDRWKLLTTDDGAKFDMTIELQAENIAPQVTWAQTGHGDGRKRPRARSWLVPES